MNQQKCYLPLLFLFLSNRLCFWHQLQICLFIHVPLPSLSTLWHISFNWERFNAEIKEITALFISNFINKSVVLLYCTVLFINHYVACYLLICHLLFVYKMVIIIFLQITLFNLLGKNILTLFINLWEHTWQTSWVPFTVWIYGTCK